MNPRAAINDLHPFQGGPFSHLGTSPRQLESSNHFIADNQIYIMTCVINGEGGIRTHAPLRTNGFQDRLVMTTSIPLHALFVSDASVILTNGILYVNKIFEKNIKKIEHFSNPVKTLPQRLNLPAL